MSETPAVYSAICAVQADLAHEGIAKNRKNQQQGYAFRGIDDCYAAISPLLSKHRLCILPRVVDFAVTERETQKGGTLFYTRIKCDFDFVSAEDGSKHTVTTLGEAMDSGDKSGNKAQSAAYKYACLQAFCIPTEGDNDADAQTHEVAPKAAAPAPNTHPPPSMADRAHAAMLKLDAALDAKDREVVKGLLAFAAVPGKGLDLPWVRWLQTHAVHAILERLPTNGEMPDLSRELNQLGLITPGDYALIQAKIDAEAVPA